MGSLGYVMIYDAYKQKHLCSLAPAEKNPSFKLDWNQNEPSFILVGNQTGKSFVLRVSPDYKSMTVIDEKNHGTAVFGVCWSPANRDTYAIGCMDGSVRICSMTKADTKNLVGHEKRVFNVVYNQQLPHILASGSDDQTIAIWNTDTLHQH